MSWLNRNETLNRIPQSDQWPCNSQFYSPQLDDIGLVDLLLQKDTFFDIRHSSEQQTIYLSVGDDGALKSSISVSLDDDNDIWATHSRKTKSMIVLTHFARVYGAQSKGAVRISRERWLNLIEKLALPPSALELLYDNNGGSATRISSCSTTKTCPTAHGKPCTYHIWLKPSDWANSEHFVYARHDFHTGQNLLLCTSNESISLATKLTARLEQDPNLSLFHILYAQLSFCFYSVENGRWEVDDGIFQLEQRTGQSHFVGDKGQEVPLDELKLTKEVAWARNWLQEVIKAATLLERIYVFTEAELQRYVNYDGSIADFDRSMPHGAVAMLSDAYQGRVNQIRAQLLQMQGLQTRVQTQFDHTSALISQRDNQINIKIAAATLADSQLMKGISLVTMVFLPATFFATFFSMIFFDLSSSDESAVEGNTAASSFSASKWIWVYFVCTVPLTILLLWEYGLKIALKDLYLRLRRTQTERSASPPTMS